MIPVLLLDELCQFLTETIKNYELDTFQSTNRAPAVYCEALPLNTTSSQDEPYILVRLKGGEDQTGQSKATVTLDFCVYSENVQQGPFQLLNVMERVRQALFQKRVLAKKYRIEYPLKWDKPKEQLHPEWVGLMETTWTIAQPIEEVIEYGEYFV